MQIPIQIEVERTPVLGMLHIPENQAPGSPMILMCYGLNGNCVDNNRISVSLGVHAEKTGVILSRFDYRGLGISGGEFQQISLDTKMQDSIEMAQFLDACMNGNQYSLYVLGFSDGCRIATALLETNLKIAGVVLWSPIFEIKKKFVSPSVPRKFVRHPETKEIVFPFKGLWMNQKHLRQQIAMSDDYQKLCDFRGKKLVILGGNDIATRTTFEELQQTNPIPDITKIVIEDADHLYSRKVWTDHLISNTLRWILS